MGRTVLAQSALAWALAPATLKIWVGFEAKPTALTHGPTLVEVNCGRQGRRGTLGWGGAENGCRETVSLCLVEAILPSKLLSPFPTPEWSPGSRNDREK